MNFFKRICDWWCSGELEEKPLEGTSLDIVTDGAKKLGLIPLPKPTGPFCNIRPPLKGEWYFDLKKDEPDDGACERYEKLLFEVFEVLDQKKGAAVWCPSYHPSMEFKYENGSWIPNDKKTVVKKKKKRVKKSQPKTKERHEAKNIKRKTKSRKGKRS